MYLHFNAVAQIFGLNSTIFIFFFLFKNMFINLFARKEKRKRRRGRAGIQSSQKAVDLPLLRHATIVLVGTVPAWLTVWHAGSHIM